MSVISKYAVSIGLLAVGTIFFLVLSQMKTAPASLQRDVQPPSVITTPVKLREGGFYLDADGEVVPYREVTLSAEVAGTVQMKAPQCFAGQYVRQGELLLQIETDDYDLEVKRLSELENQAEISVEELVLERENTLKLIALANEDLQLQRKELERILLLNRRNVATESDLDTARRNELSSRNNMQTLQNQKLLLNKRKVRFISERQQIAAELKKAKLDLARTEIRATIDGIITEDLVEEGAFVERGAAVVRIEDTSKVEVHFNLQYSQLQWLWRYTDKKQSGDKRLSGSSYELPHLPIIATLTLEDASYQWEGRLARYDGAGVNAATRTVPCVAIVEERTPKQINAEGLGNLAAPPALLRGMFVAIQIKIDPRSPLLSVPASAVRPGDRLWIFRDGALATEQVDVVMIVDGQALIPAGHAPIREGDQIITSPLPMAIAGMPLRQANSTSASPVQSSRVGDKSK
jgi:multidrug efflux pump subunit AcrA (membrane-fusion protein)